MLRGPVIATVASALASAFVATSACSLTDTSSLSGGAPEGAEMGPCRSTRERCDVGLVCLSNFCVKPAAGDGGSSGADGTADSSNEASAFDAAGCQGTHPPIDGDLRYCGPGDCYCAGADMCFASDRVAICCAANSSPTCY